MDKNQFNCALDRLESSAGGVDLNWLNQLLRQTISQNDNKLGPNGVVSLLANVADEVRDTHPLYDELLTLAVRAEYPGEFTEPERLKNYNELKIAINTLR